MRSQCLIRRFRIPLPRCVQRRTLLTLAIETSCDDTSVAILEKHKNNSATLHFHETITSDNLKYGGVHPIEALSSHQKSLAGLINQALRSLPKRETTEVHGSILVKGTDGTQPRQKPDFVTVTRGPGMRSSLYTGLNTAKGLAVAWQVPLLGVNHMQAHALTPRLVAALDAKAVESTTPLEHDPAFPFLTLLVSGGHTMLVNSRSLCDHEILANMTDMAVGDAIDKCARDILPPAYLETATDVMYGRLLEAFAFPDKTPNFGYTPPSSFLKPRGNADHGYGWEIGQPFTSQGAETWRNNAALFTYSGLGSTVRRIKEQNLGMDDEERRALAKVTMAVAFEQLASRVLFALERSDVTKVDTLVVSGGVASNQFLKHILRTVLDSRGYEKIRVVFPPIKFCTDNAAMIAWTGIEMFEAGWRTSLEAMAVRKWAIDPRAEDGGILGVEGWERAE